MNRTIVNITVIVSILMMLILIFAPACYAADGGFNPGQKAGNWALDQILWAGFVVIAVVGVALLIKKAWIPAVIFVIMGGLLLYIVSSPESILSVGEKLAGIVGL